MPEFEEKVRVKDVLALRDSGKALLCRIQDKEIWIPHSTIDDDSEVYATGHKGTLVISQRIADQKGLS
jgi:hypothetical protein